MEVVLTEEQEKQFARLALALGETVEAVRNMSPQERWEED